jgi:hypothetical protein
MSESAQGSAFFRQRALLMQYYAYAHCRPDKEGVHSIFYIGKGNLSKAHTGKKHTHETKTKMSETQTKRNIGNHWFNNGLNNVFVKTCPIGFCPGMLRNKI